MSLFLSTTRRVLACSLPLLFAALGALSWGAAHAAADNASTVIHMLDYVSVDYPETVKEGRVEHPGEYQEQQEFAEQVLATLEQLPAVPGKAALLEQAHRLRQRIDGKAPGQEVATLARALAAELVRAYGIVVAPRQAPELTRGAALFVSQCAACHGMQGRGDGPLARGMAPAPSNFHDAGRMDKRSIYGLYNTITLGVGGTPMRAFSELPDADRWTLAFWVGGLRDTEATKDRGAALWREGVGQHELGDLPRLVGATTTDLTVTGHGELDAVRAYLSANPGAVAASGPTPLAIARSELAQSLAAYRAGDRAGARQAAIRAYLEGFELVEAGLDNVDPGLRQRAEAALMALRVEIDAGKPVADLERRVGEIDRLMDEAQARLAQGQMSAGAAFTSSLLILLREGLEALLVLAAILAFVRKTGRRDALPYIHAGWVAAVVLGVATWFAASRFLSVSGASREVTEGVAALLAAAMLLYVGLWLHNRSHAQAWQAFIREKVTAALGRRTLWAMAGISFLAVYRELFEVILFYETLLAQAGAPLRPQVLAGMATSVAILAVVGGIILKYSARLPIGRFFSATSWLLVVMAVIFVGHGVAALQEAGLLASTPIRFIAVPMLGVHPNLQGLAAQGAMLALTVVVLLAGRRARRGQPT